MQSSTREVLVAGVGLTPFDTHPDRTGRDLFAEAGLRAFEDADVPRGHVEELYYGNFVGGVTERQGHQAPLMAEAVGISAPATRFENACASGGAAVRRAVQSVRHGERDVVLVGGMERLTNVSTPEATDALGLAADELYEGRAGVTFPGAYALMARAYFHQFGGDRTDLAHVAVKNHRNALSNEYAQFQREIGVDDVLDAPDVAEPLGLYDASPITDGAAALVLVSGDYAADHALDPSVRVAGTGQGSDTLALHDRASLTATPATERAAETAFSDAGVGPGGVDVVELHDCFTIAEPLALEAMGFYAPGEALGAARRGETTAEGSLPVNLSGGLKAKGHPVGATGCSQVVEVTRLLRGTHPNSGDVPDARVGVTHNAGGTVASATVHVLEVVA